MVISATVASGAGAESACENSPGAAPTSSITSRARRLHQKLRRGVVGVHAEYLHLLARGFDFGLGLLRITLRLLEILLRDGVVLQQILRASQRLLLHLIVGERLVIIRDGPRQVAALELASVCPFSTRSQGRTFISTIRPPAGANTCTTRVGSARCARADRDIRESRVMRAVSVWMPLASGATYSVPAELDFAVFGGAELSSESPEPQPSQRKRRGLKVSELTSYNDSQARVDATRRNGIRK